VNWRGRKPQVPVRISDALRRAGLLHRNPSLLFATKHLRRLSDDFDGFLLLWRAGASRLLQRIGDKPTLFT
jgi:hypothetical protein